MFHEVFDWTDERDVQGKQVQVAPGDVVEASVAFTPAADFATSGLGSYAMSMTSRDTKEQLTYTYDLLPGQKSSEATAYFVLEHQPFTCRGSLPGNGNVTWTDIKVEVNGAPVATPQWEAKQEQPKCVTYGLITHAWAGIRRHSVVRLASGDAHSTLLLVCPSSHSFSHSCICQ